MIIDQIHQMETASKVYALAEQFTSPQGEGVHTGVMMHFIRLAGCTVGKPFSKVEREHMEPFPIYTEKCTLYDGRNFKCDTDYRVHSRENAASIAQGLNWEATTTVCISGGEPLAFDLNPLIIELKKAEPYVRIHVETSGTIPLDKVPYALINWLTVSPKKGFIDEYAIWAAHEAKLLVDEDFDIAAIPASIIERVANSAMEDSRVPFRVYLQPVNGEYHVEMSNMKRCLKLQQKYPFFSISIQAHKIWNVR